MAEVNSVTQSSEQLNKMAEALTTQSPLPKISENEAQKGGPQNIHEENMHKNRLQELTQRSSLDRPVYHTVNAGSQHAPLFRSSVLVDVFWYTSPRTFSHLKAAEQDAARVALIGVKEKLKDEGCPLIREALGRCDRGMSQVFIRNGCMKEWVILLAGLVDLLHTRIIDTVFCKSIMNEYAVKMHLERPTYQTVQSVALLPVFKSTSVFNGIHYTGETGKNKKEAEQLAARAAVMSILETDSGSVMLEIIKSKRKLYAALDKVQDTGDFNACFLPTELGRPVHVDNKRKEVEGAGEKTNTGLAAYSLGQPSDVQAPNQLHVFKRPNTGSSSVEVAPPIVFVPPVLDPSLPCSTSGPSLLCSTSTKKRRNKKKAKKNVQVDPQYVF
ncbi:hypothetical protein RND71_011716 [Anisodus tanguticus]|uniref:DRBM domain-containing protein n=1 Tax=Anisodus tanguticus TaxID=243964 RepID=A0AAE1SE98_9SOLA|nr:hypothetical protein RND71_011716 [Anisodus tanguticus]